ncbi:MAG: hypothetical protein ACTJLM_01550 [Ehrlichia sp.]
MFINFIKQLNTRHISPTVDHFDMVLCGLNGDTRKIIDIDHSSYNDLIVYIISNAAKNLSAAINVIKQFKKNADKIISRVGMKETSKESDGACVINTSQSLIFYQFIQEMEKDYRSIYDCSVMDETQRTGSTNQHVYNVILLIKVITYTSIYNFVVACNLKEITDVESSTSKVEEGNLVNLRSIFASIATTDFAILKNSRISF